MSTSTVLTLGFGSFGGAKYLPTLGYDTTATPPPTPPAAPSTGSGGGRYFGYYPERQKELKAEIKAVVREKKKVERKLKLAPQNADLGRLAELLTELQARLGTLVTEYQMYEPEDEEFLVRLFAESFYE